MPLLPELNPVLHRWIRWWAHGDSSPEDVVRDHLGSRAEAGFDMTTIASRCTDGNLRSDVALST